MSSENTGRTAHRSPAGLRTALALLLAAATAVPASAAAAAETPVRTGALVAATAAAAVPDAVSGITVTGGSASTLSFDWPDASRADGYDVYFGDYATLWEKTDVSRHVTESHVTFSGLKAGTEYGIRVTPTNSAGRGAGGSRQKATTLADGETWHTSLPEAIGKITYPAATWTKSGSTVTLDWPDAKRANRYQVLVSTSYDGVFQSTPVKTVSASTATVTGLKAGTEYTITVRGVNNVGAGPSAARTKHTARTEAEANIPWYTSVPADLGFVQVTGSSLAKDGATLTVDWPDAARATGYEVYASTSYDGILKMTSPTMRTTASKATATKLKKGTNYYVRVVPTNNVGRGAGSARVGHTTIASEATNVKGYAPYALMTWNVCSNVCANMGGRKAIIDARIRELNPGIVALQEASKYTTPAAGYTFAANGQNDILIRTGVFAKVPVKNKVATTGSKRFPSKFATSGHGTTWAALKHGKSGKYIVVFNTHLVVGETATLKKQRQYEAEQLNAYVTATMTNLGKTYPALKNAAVVLLGDFNTNRVSPSEQTFGKLRQLGWYDAYEQARVLSGKHYSTAAKGMKATVETSYTWGGHVDHVFVKPGRSIVQSWANAGKMKSGKWVTPMGSDHHPVLVKGYFR